MEIVVAMVGETRLKACKSNWGASPQSGSWGRTAPRLAGALCEEKQLGVLYIFVGKGDGWVLVIGRSDRD